MQKTSIFLNKFLFILSMIILCLFTFTINCFAYTSNDINSITNNRPYIIYKLNNSTFLAFSTDSTVTTIVHNAKTNWFGFCHGTNDSQFVDVAIYEYNNSTDKFSYLNTGGMNVLENLPIEILYTNVDIINYYNRDEVFFQKTPVRLELTQVLEKTEVTKMFQNLMKKLVVSLLVFLIGLIGLRKAWTFLKTALHKA